MKNKNRKKILASWLPVIIWASVIFYLSSLKQVSTLSFFVYDFFLKKLAHVSEYAILYVLIFRATQKKYLLSFSLVMLYAVTDEIHQSFVPGRTATALDLGFDLSGSNIAAYILWKQNQLRQSKLKK